MEKLELKGSEPWESTDRRGRTERYNTWEVVTGSVGRQTLMDIRKSQKDPVSSAQCEAHRGFVTPTRKIFVVCTGTAWGPSSGQTAEVT